MCRKVYARDGLAFTALFIQLGLSWILYVTRDVLKNRLMSGMDRAMKKRRNGFL
jgi:hypothetical protein